MDAVHAPGVPDKVNILGAQMTRDDDKGTGLLTQIFSYGFDCHEGDFWVRVVRIKGKVV